MFPLHGLSETRFRFSKMPTDVTNPDLEAENSEGAKRPVRADARRNLDALLQGALAVFAVSGVDAPVREIAERAGVGVATVYRHFPQRSDLIAAVFRREIDACADAAPVLADEHAPFEAQANRQLLNTYLHFNLGK